MVDQNPKRSGEPPVWLMFGAGGTVSAIFFPVVILILGLLLPFGLIAVSYTHLTLPTKRIV